MTDHPRSLSRRSVNAFLASAVVWPCNKALSRLTPHQADDPRSLQHMLLSLFGNPRRAYAIGVACLKAFPPDQICAQQLSNAILARSACDGEAMKSQHTLRHRIATQVRQDFSEGAFVSVDGWLLSLTEARLYALVALSFEQPGCTKMIGEFLKIPCSQNQMPR